MLMVRWRWMQLLWRGENWKQVYIVGLLLHNVCDNMGLSFFFKCSNKMTLFLYSILFPVSGSTYFGSVVTAMRTSDTTLC
jgi:hypothetical protein